MTTAATPQDTISHREIQDILRTFRESGWTAMTLEVDGMRITVGKNGPPAARPPRPAAPSTATGAVAVEPVAGEPSRPAPAAPARPAADDPRTPAHAAPTPPGADTTGCLEVRSPTVGAFWVAPSPGEAPFVGVGQRVEAGEQIAIVEVMKLMNPVVAPAAGEIVRVCANNSDLVEYEQVLFLIRLSDD